MKAKSAANHDVFLLRIWVLMTTAPAGIPLNEVGRNSSRSTHGTNNCAYEDFIMNSVADMFNKAIGHTTTSVLFHTFGILQPMIFARDRMVRLQCLNDALDESFGNFANTIKKIILEKLCEDMQVSDDDNCIDPKDFVSAIMRLEPQYNSLK